MSTSSEMKSTCCGHEYKDEFLHQVRVEKVQTENITSLFAALNALLTNHLRQLFGSGWLQVFARSVKGKHFMSLVGK